jgi:TonB family protein
LPAEKVQTGGFGDNFGVAASNTSARPGNIARVGSFDLPSGAGRGNGTGGEQGKPGVVASAGFGNGIAVGGDGSGGKGRGAPKAAGFADATAAVESPSRPRTIEATTSSVEVLSKPKPEYTEEARKLHVEGEVVLQVVFTASGEVQITHVVQGLGHGLDEAAIRATSKIRFKPAQRDGKAVNTSALLHILFQIT